MAGVRRRQSIETLFAPPQPLSVTRPAKGTRLCVYPALLRPVIYFSMFDMYLARCLLTSPGCSKVFSCVKIQPRGKGHIKRFGPKDSDPSWGFVAQWRQD